MQADVRQGWLQIQLDKSCDGLAMDTFLREKLHLPEKFCADICKRGLVRVRNHTATIGTRLEAGQTLFLADPVDLNPTQHISVTSATTIPDILYEDAHVLVVAKEAGMIVHSSDPQELTLDGQVALYYQVNGLDCRVLHAHRLDKGTTGAVVYAKHGFMARALDDAIVNRTLHRTYLAVTFGRKWKRRTTVDAAIGRDRHRSGLYLVSSTGKIARTYVNVVTESVQAEGTLSLLKCQLDTGRTHQIRVHTSYMSAPIVGDVAYHGVSEIDGFPGHSAIALHAREVEFVHPYDGQKVVVKAPLNGDWQTFFRQQWGIEGDA